LYKNISAILGTEFDWTVFAAKNHFNMEPLNYKLPLIVIIVVYSELTNFRKKLLFVVFRNHYTQVTWYYTVNFVAFTTGWTLFLAH